MFNILQTRLLQKIIRFLCSSLHHPVNLGHSHHFKTEANMPTNNFRFFFDKNVSFVLKLKAFDLVENENDKNSQLELYVIKCLGNKYVSFQTD